MFILTDKYLDNPLNRTKIINQHIKHSGVPKICRKLIGKVAQWTIAVSTPCCLNCNNTEPSTLQKDWKSVNF